MHDNRYDVHTTIQSGLDFASHKVCGIVKTALSKLITRVEPRRSDDCEQYLTVANGLINELDKVYCHWNGIHFHQYALASEAAYEFVVNRFRNLRRITTSVGDETNRALRVKAHVFRFRTQPRGRAATGNWEGAERLEAPSEFPDSHPVCQTHNGQC